MNQPNRHQNKVTKESLCIWLNLLLFTISSLVLVTGLLLLGSKLEMLGTLDAHLLLALAFLTFHTKHNLTRSLGLLVKDGLCLTTETHLLRVVTTLSLGEIGCLSCLVLGHLVNLVLSAVLSCAVSSAFLWDIDHDCKVRVAERG